MLLNISHNFIPDKIILCDDKDSPWMDKEEKLATSVSMQLTHQN